MFSTIQCHSTHCRWYWAILSKSKAVAKGMVLGNLFHCDAKSNPFETNAVNHYGAKSQINPAMFLLILSQYGNWGPSKQDHVKTWESKVYIASIGPNMATCESYHRRFVIGGHHKGFLVMHDGYQTKLPEFQETYMAYKKLWLILNDFIRL